MVWFGVPREMLVLFDFGPRETYFPPKLAYASRGGTTALEAYQRLSRAEIPRETLKTMTWLYKENFSSNIFGRQKCERNIKYLDKSDIDVAQPTHVVFQYLMVVKLNPL